MNSQQAKAIIGTALRQAADRRRGYGPVAKRLSGFRALELMVADVTKLPAVYTEDTLQDEEGRFLIMAGYSSLGGGDVLG